MNTISPVNTWDVLKDFGFHWDLDEDNSSPRGPSDESSGLYYGFGNLKLRASQQINLRFRPIVYFTWRWPTPPARTFHFGGVDELVVETDFELPRQVASPELCAALIAYYLDKLASTGQSDPFTLLAGGVPRCLRMGRVKQHLLPWEQQKRAFEDRPRCTVERSSIKPVLRLLQEYVGAATNDAIVIFSFELGELGIEFGGSRLILPARGDRWPSRYGIPTAKLRRLPQRLPHSTEVGVWDSKLWINRWGYPGVEPVEGESTARELIGDWSVARRRR